MYYAIRPTSEFPAVLSSEDILSWLRTDESEVNLAYRLLRSAMNYAEGYAGQPLFERTFTVEVTGYSGAFLPGVNPRSVTIAYTATNGEAATWTPSIPYESTDAFRVLTSGKVQFSSSLTQPLYGTYATLTYTAGYESGSVPEDIIQALLLITADSYDNRGNGVSERMTAADRLLLPYKIYTV